MGHPANFVIVEGGLVSFYYSSWGAISLPFNLFRGVNSAISYIKDLTPLNGLVLCNEGAMIVDRDASCLLFCVSDMRNYPGVLRYFLPLVRYSWPGWEVSWADQGDIDVALRLGIDPAELRYGDAGERRFEVADLAAEPEYILTIVTIGGAAGATDCGFEEELFSVLAHGPGLLDQLRGRAEVSLVEVEDLESGAFVDPDRKEIWVWDNNEFEDLDLARVAGLWPGWTVIRHDGGLCEQVRLSGRDASKLELTVDRAVRQIAGLVFEGQSFDVDRPEPGEDATRQMFRRAVAALRAGEIRPEPVKTRGRVIVPAKGVDPSTPGPG